nr:hypothetical protein [uncultured Flavobacterium sp.]
MNPKAKRYKYNNIVQYMEEISEQQSNGKYRVVILSAIKKYYDYLVLSPNGTIFEPFSKRFEEISSLRYSFVR